MYTVRLCFYGELNDFIGPEPRGTQYERRFPQARSVKDLIESEGVPHPEIERILVNGKPQMLDALVIDGDCICVYPSESRLIFLWNHILAARHCRRHSSWPTYNWVS